MQVLPRFLITYEEEWEPHLYAENELGNYQEVKISHNFLKLESKYPDYHSKVWNGVKYFWYYQDDGSAAPQDQKTSFHVASGDKLVLLFKHSSLLQVTPCNE